MQFYGFTVGFFDSESPPVLIAGPDVSVPDQEDALDARARVDDGGGFAVIEIVFSNGRPTRRVTFTTPEEQAAQQAKAAEAATAKAEAEAKAKADRIAELKAELAALEPGAVGEQPPAPSSESDSLDADKDPAEPDDQPGSVEVPAAADGSLGPIGPTGPIGPEGIPAAEDSAAPSVSGKKKR
jgi:hypothetical protein